MKTLALILACLLSGCSALNSVGIGGDLALFCKYRDATAHADDPLAGSDAVRLSMIRRFKDADELCRRTK